MVGTIIHRHIDADDAGADPPLPPLPPLLHMGGPESLSRVEMGERIIAACSYSPIYPATAAATSSKPKIQPTERAAVDIGYAAPLDIGMDSAALEAALGMRMTAAAAALRESLS